MHHHNVRWRDYVWIQADIASKYFNPRLEFGKKISFYREIQGSCVIFLMTCMLYFWTMDMDKEARSGLISTPVILLASEYANAPNITAPKREPTSKICFPLKSGSRFLNAWDKFSREAEWDMKAVKRHRKLNTIWSNVGNLVVYLMVLCFSSHRQCSSFWGVCLHHTGYQPVCRHRGTHQRWLLLQDGSLHSIGIHITECIQYYVHI